jgi:dienelactone hydrolase
MLGPFRQRSIKKEVDMKKPILAVLALTVCSALARAEVQGKEVDYSDGEIAMKGYVAYDDAFHGRRPGVLVVHEWWGSNAYARKRARMLAEMGYTALAVDMYGDGRTADHPKDAGAFSAEVSKNLGVERARFDAALKTLQAQPTVEPGELAAIGYCFGGGVVLNMARMGLPLKGVASFHGSLAPATPDQPGMARIKVAVFTGADDPMAPPALVQAFRQELDRAGVNYQLVSYPGAKHSFTNPQADEYGKKFGLPLAYDAYADRDSWGRMAQFLGDLFAKDQ